MTKVICPKTSCICSDEEKYCTREEIELELDLCEVGLMDCKYFEEEK